MISRIFIMGKDPYFDSIEALKIGLFQSFDKWKMIKNVHWFLDSKRTCIEHKTHAIWAQPNTFVIFEEFEGINGLLKASHKRKINSVIESKISSA